MKLVLYVFHEYNEKVIYFLNNCIFYDEDIEFLIIINNSLGVITIPENLPNVKVVNRMNRGQWFGAWSYGLMTIDYQKYTHFIFVNSTAVGPFIPKYYKGKWTDIFIDGLQDVKLFGASICFNGVDVFVQDYIFSMEKETLQYLIDCGIFGFENKEIEMSKKILQKWNIGSLGYQGIDFREKFDIPNYDIMDEKYRNILWNDYELVFVKKHVDPQPCCFKYEEKIYKRLNINFGVFDDSHQQQEIILHYLKKDAKVLEIGSDIGRMSLIIASILEDSSNLVALESNIHAIDNLTINRDINGFHFHIENSALSNFPLIQKNWNVEHGETVKDGYFKVNTLTLDELYNKYKINFDTLIVDCEGSFFGIMNEMPQILKGIKLIIIENDYPLMFQKKFVDDVLKSNNFSCVYYEKINIPTSLPCGNNFFEVWQIE